LTKRVILITGTPRTGKTSTSHLLASKLDALYINLTDLAKQEKLTLGKDKKRNTTIIDQKAMKQKLTTTIKNSQKNNIIIDGHYASNVISKKLASHVFILRRNPIELRKIMEQTGFTKDKLWENLASEILDVCLFDAVNAYGQEKVCEIDATGKSTEKTVSEILEVLDGKRKCHIGIVDWLGMLERENILNDYLKI
jgi:broad-specificity NMP kinase